MIRLDTQNIDSGWERILVKSHMEMSCQYAVTPIFDQSYFNRDQSSSFLVMGGITNDEDLLSDIHKLTLSNRNPKLNKVERLLSG